MFWRDFSLIESPKNHDIIQYEQRQPGTKVWSQNLGGIIGQK